MKTLLLAALLSLTLLPTKANAVLSLYSLGDRYFQRSCTITSAAAATAVHCLAASDVPSNGKVYVSGFFAKINGATPWATTATCALQDTAASPVAVATIAVAAMTNAAFITPVTSNVTLATTYSLGTGVTQAKGLDIKCNAVGTGSDMVVTVYGTIRRVP